MWYHPTSMFGDEHPFRDELEAYALGRCAPDDLERIENHLLICERCQDEVSQTDEYRRAMKGAVATLRNGSPNSTVDAAIERLHEIVHQWQVLPLGFAIEERSTTSTRTEHEHVWTGKRNITQMCTIG